MRRPGAGGVLPWAILLAVLLGTAIVGAFSLQGQDRPEASDPVVGDLRLADDDEGPSDHVEHTFGAPNLAPGDTHADELEILREPFEDLPPVLEPRVEVTLHGEGSSLLASSLEIVELTYGNQSLRDEARRACGVPLTLARLDACTANDPNPLADLPDPTPEGTPFRLGVRMDEHARSNLEDRSYSFTVRVELYGKAPGEGPRSPAPGERAVPSVDPDARSPPCPGIDLRQPAGPGDLLEPRDDTLAPLPAVGPIGPLWPGGPRATDLLGTHLIELC